MVWINAYHNLSLLHTCDRVVPVNLLHVPWWTVRSSIAMSPWRVNPFDALMMSWKCNGNSRLNLVYWKTHNKYNCTKQSKQIASQSKQWGTLTVITYVLLVQAFIYKFILVSLVFFQWIRWLNRSMHCLIKCPRTYL